MPLSCRYKLYQLKYCSTVRSNWSILQLLLGNICKSLGYLNSIKLLHSCQNICDNCTFKRSSLVTSVQCDQMLQQTVARIIPQVDQKSSYIRFNIKSDVFSKQPTESQHINLAGFTTKFIAKGLQKSPNLGSHCLCCS